MEGRGNLEFVALFPVPGSRRSHGRVRHIAHIPKCQFRTPVSEALTMNNFFFAAEARTPSRPVRFPDRKSTRLNSSHDQISYAVFCLKKKKKPTLRCILRIAPTSPRDLMGTTREHT